MRNNIILTYIEQIFSIVVGLLFVPFFIQNLGISSFGLFGLFAVAQGLIQLLDAGLAPTLTRQSARFMSGVHKSEEFKTEFRISEIFFCIIALLVTVLSIAWMAYKETVWVSSVDLDETVIKICITIIIVSSAFRFISSLYKGILRGVESHKVLAIAGIGSTTLKFIIGIPVVLSSKGNPIPFFVLQLGASIVELMILRFYVIKNIPDEKTNWTQYLKILNQLWSVSGSLGILSIAWIFLSVVDKLIASKMLNLEIYGIFTIGITIASIVNLATNPIGIIAGPKLIKEIKGNEIELIRNLYLNISKYTAFFASSIAAMISFFAVEIIWIWIGDRKISNAASQIVPYYAFGYILISISTLTYLLQLARGQLKLNVIGAIIQSILLPILIYVGILKYEIQGAAYAWLFVQLLYFVLWIPVIHKDIAENLHLKWLKENILPNIFIPFIWFGVISLFIVEVENRFYQFIQLFFVYISLSLPAVLCLKELRMWMISKLSKINF